MATIQDNVRKLNFKVEKEWYIKTSCGARFHLLDCDLKTLEKAFGRQLKAVTRANLRSDMPSLQHDNVSDLSFRHRRDLDIEDQRVLDQVLCGTIPSVDCCARRQ